MATGAFTLYNEGKRRIISGEIQLGTSTLTMLLLGAGYSPDTINHTTLVDISGNEIADSDYARQTLAGVSITRSSGIVLFNADNVSFGSAVSIEAKYAAIIAGSGATSDPLICYADLANEGASATLRSVASQFEVRLPNGVFEAS